MKTILSICFAWLSLVAVDLVLAAPPEANQITKEELLPVLGRSDVIVIDLRFGRDWTDATLKIKRAVREDPMKPGMWIDKYPKEKMLVFYCDGPEDGTAASLARVLKMKGYTSAHYLKGGWREWIAAKYPTEPRDPK